MRSDNGSTSWDGNPTVVFIALSSLCVPIITPINVMWVYIYLFAAFLTLTILNTTLNIASMKRKLIS
jgi:prepilin signal peptidase PulO-like enzyme (type II secretory pathway)